MKCGKYFSFEEFTVTSTGLVNRPGPQALENIRALVALILDPLRDSVGAVRITSGYRSLEVNEAIGGAKDSCHLYGLAADLKVAGHRAEELVERMVYLNLPFERALFYHELRGGHVHVQITKRQVMVPDLWGRGAGWAALKEPQRIFWVSAQGEYIEQQVRFERRT